MKQNKKTPKNDLSIEVIKTKELKNFYLSLAVVSHDCSNSDGDVIHEEGFTKMIHCVHHCKVGEETPLLKTQG